MILLDYCRNALVDSGQLSDIVQLSEDKRRQLPRQNQVAYCREQHQLAPRPRWPAAASLFKQFKANPLKFIE